MTTRGSFSGCSYLSVYLLAPVEQKLQEQQEQQGRLSEAGFSLSNGGCNKPSNASWRASSPSCSECSVCIRA